MRVVPAMRAPIVALVWALTIAQAGATTYVPPSDFDVVALDVATGDQLWRTTLGIAKPWIEVEGRIVVVNGLYALSAETGEPLEVRLPPVSDATISPLEPLPRNLVGSQGEQFSDGGKNLEAVVSGSGQIFRRLPTFVHELHIDGSRAFFTQDSDISAGEVFAYEFGAGQLQWVFRPWTLRPRLSPWATSELALDRGRLLVSVEEVVYALDPATGELIWSTELPRQSIRHYDRAWTTFYGFEDRLYLRVYEDLFVLDRTSGVLLWSFDPGPLSSVVPTIANGRIFLAVRAGHELTMLSSSFVPHAPPEPALFRVATEPGPEISLLTRAQLPRGVVPRSLLSWPPDAETDLRIRLYDFEGQLEAELDLEDKASFVELTPWTRHLHLVQGGRIVAAKAVSSEESANREVAWVVLRLWGGLLGLQALFLLLAARKASRARHLRTATWATLTMTLGVVAFLVFLASLGVRPAHAEITPWLFALALGFVGLGLLARRLESGS